jgi:hypothetical protein
MALNIDSVDRLVTRPAPRERLNECGVLGSLRDQFSVQQTAILAATLNQPQLLKDMMELLPRQAILAVKDPLTRKGVTSSNGGVLSSSLTATM